MWQIYGQDHLLRQLEASFRLARLAHAYLLVGPPHVGKMTLALGLAQAVNCLNGPGVPCGQCGQCARIARGQHADVRIVGVAPRTEDGPARTVITIAAVKEALHQANLNPYEGRRSVIIFDGAELMSEEAANALLKTLEEPPPHALILLLTGNEDAILATVRSRCQRLQLLPAARLQLEEALRERGAEPEQAARLARLARGCLGWAVAALESPELLEQRQAELEQLQETCGAPVEGRFAFASELATRFGRDRETARQTLYLWLRWWRDLLLIKEGAEEFAQNVDQLSALRLQASQLAAPQIVAFIRATLQTLEALDRNASPRLALEVLMLRLPAARMNP